MFEGESRLVCAVLTDHLARATQCGTPQAQLETTRSIDALRAISRLVGCDENDTTLVRCLQAAKSTNVIVALCDSDAGASDYVGTVLTELLCPGSRRRRSVDWGLLKFVVALVRSTGAIRGVAAAALEMVARATDGSDQRG